jgi:RNA polymerase sigma-70 factor (ECF subfamily)
LRDAGGTEAVFLRAAGPQSATAQEESLLVARARRGDAAAFDQLYHRHRHQVYTLSLNLCGDPEEARDLLQETFLRVWRGLPRFRERSKFTTWIYRIAVNLARDAARRRRRAAPAPAAAPDPDLATVGRVRATLTQLRTPHRVVLVLRYSLSLSYEEIADLLGWSLSRVKVTLHRARRAFKDAYLDVDEDNP